MSGNAYAQIDTTPPTLVNVEVEPILVDLSKGNTQITLTLHMTDDSSGVRYASVTIHSPETTDNSGSRSFNELVNYRHRISGSAIDGIYRLVLTVAPNFPRGWWYYEPLTVYDIASNEVQYCSGLCGNPNPIPGPNPLYPFFIGPLSPNALPNNLHIPFIP